MINLTQDELTYLIIGAVFAVALLIGGGILLWKGAHNQ